MELAVLLILFGIFLILFKLLAVLLKAGIYLISIPLQILGAVFAALLVAVATGLARWP